MPEATPVTREATPTVRTPPPRPARKRSRRLMPSLWVSLVPNGFDEVKPNHYGEMARTIWENRHNLRYAWRILRKGVCDGCALGVAGFNDWTIKGVHLCTTRLSLLKINTMGAMDPAALALVEPLRERSGADLRALGRLAYPMLRRRGEIGFTRISWDAALDLAAGHIRRAGGDRLGFYLTARGITNEVYYTAQKVARFLGTNNIDNAARICHAPSTGALKRALGVAATTVSYTDVIESDLTVLFGSDTANAQPVFMKYLYMAKKRGGKVAVVNPFREPGLDRYWVPSNAESAIFGTHITDEFFPVNTGGDTAFLNGVLKVLIAEGGVDGRFVAEYTSGWPELRTSLEGQTLDDLARWSGSSVEDMTRFARMYAASRSAVFVWSMGITQHVCGTDNVAAIINLALARGNVGRVGAGLMPIRGHSGVQGGAEMGCYATVFPGGVPIDEASAERFAGQYGFPIRSERGLSAAEMVEAAGRGELDVLWSSGGNFLDTLPDPMAVRVALERVPLRVHQDILVSSQMLLDAGEAVLLLPAATRYEQEGGGTETTTERRVAFSPELSHPEVGEARSEWRIFTDLARHVDPERAHLASFESGQAIREEIARVVPFYDGIQHLAKTGDAIQWGGERLCDDWTFPTTDGLAHFQPVAPREAEVPPGRFVLSTRRGKQFNSLVWQARDPLTGADRDALFMARADVEALGLRAGDPVIVRSPTGEVRARIRPSDIRPRNVQMFFPEANPVIAPGTRDPVALVPDYNAVVEVIPVGAPPAAAAPGGEPRPTVGVDVRRGGPPASRSAASPAVGPEEARRRQRSRDGNGRRPLDQLAAAQPVPASTGVVLAGGRSTRFGSDKLIEPYGDGLLIHRAVLALAGVCREVIVVIPPETDAPPLPVGLPVPMRVVRDREPYGGPLVGLLAAAATAEQQWLVVAGGDMPQLHPEVLRLMLRRAAGVSVDADGRRLAPALAVALEERGMRRPLPCVVGRASTADAASDLVASGRRSLRELLDGLDAVTLSAAVWRTIDPEGGTLRDVDAPTDLAAVALTTPAT